MADTRVGYELLSERAVLGMIASIMDRPYDGEDWVGRISSPLIGLDAEEGKFPFAGATPTLERKQGGPRYQGVRTKDIKIQNEEFDAGLAIPEKWRRRDMLGVLEQKAQEFRENVKLGHFAELLSEKLADAESGLGYDGAAFIGASHQWGESGVQSNLLEMDPDDDFPSDALVGEGGIDNPSIQSVAWAITAAANRLRSFKNDRGKRISMMGKKFLIMATTKTFPRLAHAVSLPVLGGGEINLVQGLAQRGWSFEVVQNPFLDESFDQTGEFSFLVFNESAPRWPMVRHFERLPDGDDEGVAFQMKDESSDHYKDNRELQVNAYTNRGCQYGEPLVVVKTKIVESA